MKELVNRLDEFGNNIEVIDKDLAHQNGYFHTSVHVWIINDKKEILLQKRSSNKSFFPNFWDVSFAGHVGYLETPLMAVVREGKEELGIDIDLKKLSFLFTYKENLKYNKINSNEFVHVYLYEDNIKTSEIKYQEEEVSIAKYFKLESFFKELVISNELINHSFEYKMLREVIRD